MSKRVSAFFFGDSEPDTKRVKDSDDEENEIEETEEAPTTMTTTMTTSLSTRTCSKHTVISPIDLLPPDALDFIGSYLTPGGFLLRLCSKTLRATSRSFVT